MALGELVIKLSADTARLQSDLGRGVHMAENFARQMKSALGAIGVGLTFAGLTAFIKESVDAAARLDDMAEKTGASVENLSKLSQVARISGTDIGIVETFLVKLNKALHDTDEESKGANRALEAIGLRAKELRSLDPAEAMKRVAEQLNKFADGGGKTAAILALTGKSAAEALPFLKDLATETGITARVTAEQAAAAEELQKSIRRLGNAWTEAAQALARDLIPGLTRILEQFSEGIRLAGGFWGAVRTFGTINPFKTPGENIKSLNESLVELEAKRDQFIAQGRTGWLPQVAAEIEQTKKQIEFSKLLQRQEALAGPTGRGRLDAKDLGPGGGARLDFSAPGAAAKPKAEVDRQKEINKAYVLAAEQILGLDEASLKLRDEMLRKDEELRKAHELLGATMQKQLLETIDLEQELYGERERTAGLSANKGKSALEDLEEATKKSADAAKELGMTFVSAFEDAVIGGKKAREVVQALLQDLARVFLRRGVTEPLTAAAGSIDWSKMLKSLISGSLASGTDYVPRTGLYQLHQGEQVIPAGGSGDMNFTFQFSGGEPTDPQQFLAVAVPVIRSVVRGEMGQQMRPGGAFNPA